MTWIFSLLHFNIFWEVLTIVPTVRFELTHLRIKSPLPYLLGYVGIPGLRLSLALEEKSDKEVSSKPEGHCEQDSKHYATEGCLFNCFHMGVGISGSSDLIVHLYS